MNPGPKVSKLRKPKKPKRQVMLVSESDLVEEQVEDQMLTGKKRPRPTDSDFPDTPFEQLPPPHKRLRASEGITGTIRSLYHRVRKAIGLPTDFVQTSDIATNREFLRQDGRDLVPYQASEFLDDSGLLNLMLANKSIIRSRINRSLKLYQVRIRNKFPALAGIFENSPLYAQRFRNAPKDLYRRLNIIHTGLSKSQKGHLTEEEFNWAFKPPEEIKYLHGSQEVLFLANGNIDFIIGRNIKLLLDEGYSQPLIEAEENRLGFLLQASLHYNPVSIFYGGIVEGDFAQSLYCSLVLGNEGVSNDILDIMAMQYLYAKEDNFEDPQDINTDLDLSASGILRFVNSEGFEARKEKAKQGLLKELLNDLDSSQYYRRGLSGVCSSFKNIAIFYGFSDEIRAFINQRLPAPQLIEDETVMDTSEDAIAAPARIRM